MTHVYYKALNTQMRMMSSTPTALHCTAPQKRACTRLHKVYCPYTSHIQYIVEEQSDNATYIAPQVNEIIPELLSVNVLAAAQESCNDIGPMLMYLRTNELPADPKKARAILFTHSQYFIENGLLFHTDHVNKHVTDGITPSKQLCIPITMRHDLLQSRHEHAGHPGGAKLYLSMKPSFHWDRMFADAKAYSQSCKACQANKVDTHVHKSPLQHIKVDSPHHVWSIDVLSMPRSRQGCELLLVCIDNFSLYPELVPIKDQKAETIAEAIFTHIVANHGTPRSIISDRGSNFTSAVCTQLCKLLRVDRVFTASYRQQADVAECQNKLILSTLRTMGDRDDRWQDNLPAVLLAHRSTPTPARGGLSPYFLLHGREMQVPDTVRFEAALNKKMPLVSKQYLQSLSERLNLAHEIATEHIRKTQQHNKRQYDKHAQDTNYHVGDKVWLRNMYVPPGHNPKLYHRYAGPYYITQALDEYTFHLRECNTNKRLQAPVAADRLKPVIDRTHKLSYAQQLEEEHLNTDSADTDTITPVAVGTHSPIIDSAQSTLDAAAQMTAPAASPSLQPSVDASCDLTSSLNDRRLVPLQPSMHQSQTFTHNVVDNVNITDLVRRKNDLKNKQTSKQTNTQANKQTNETVQPTQSTIPMVQDTLPNVDLQAQDPQRLHDRYSLRRNPKPNVALKQIDHLLKCSINADGTKTYLCKWQDGTPPSWVLQAHIPDQLVQQYYINYDQKRRRKS